MKKTTRFVAPLLAASALATVCLATEQPFEDVSACETATPISIVPLGASSDVRMSVQEVYHGAASDIPEHLRGFVGITGRGYENIPDYTICVWTNEEGQAIQSAYGQPGLWGQSVGIRHKGLSVDSILLAHDVLHVDNVLDLNR